MRSKNKQNASCVHRTALHSMCLRAEQWRRLWRWRCRHILLIIIVNRFSSIFSVFLSCQFCVVCAVRARLGRNTDTCTCLIVYALRRFKSFVVFFRHIVSNWKLIRCAVESDTRIIGRISMNQTARISMRSEKLTSPNARTLNHSAFRTYDFLLTNWYRRSFAPKYRTAAERIF